MAVPSFNSVTRVLVILYLFLDVMARCVSAQTYKTDSRVRIVCSSDPYVENTFRTLTCEVDHQDAVASCRSPQMSVHLNEDTTLCQKSVTFTGGQCSSMPVAAGIISCQRDGDKRKFHCYFNVPQGFNDNKPFCIINCRRSGYAIRTEPCEPLRVGSTPTTAPPTAAPPTAAPPTAAPPTAAPPTAAPPTAAPPTAAPPTAAPPTAAPPTAAPPTAAPPTVAPATAPPPTAAPPTAAPAAPPTAAPPTAAPPTAAPPTAAPPTGTPPTAAPPPLEEEFPIWTAVLTAIGIAGLIALCLCLVCLACKKRRKAQRGRKENPEGENAEGEKEDLEGSEAEPTESAEGAEESEEAEEAAEGGGEAPAEE